VIHAPAGLSTSSAEEEKQVWRDALAAMPDPSCETSAVLRLGTIVLGAEDVDRAAHFWAEVFGYEVVTFPDAEDGFTILVPPDRAGTRIAVHRSHTPVQEQPRVHLDLVVDSADEQAAEVERLVALGATRVPWEYPDDSDVVVLADTEGNRFCIVDASHG
jgi:predicted enzyme related to lactoylglutathione lyase